MLAGRADLDAINEIDSFVDLSVLPAGTLPPNPQELLSRAALPHLNTAASKRATTWCCTTSPPFAHGADALAVAGRAGGVLLVARRRTIPGSPMSARMAEQIGAGRREGGRLGGGGLLMMAQPHDCELRI